MRVLVTGNSPFCQTGYGVQSAQLALYLKQIGHEPAIFAYYGLGGSKIEWNGIPIYPNPAEDYGAKWVEQVYEHFEADCLITLVDVWVLGMQPTKCKWFPWCVTGETEVITREGNIPIEKARNITEVLTADVDGNLLWAKVNKFHELPVRTDIYELYAGDQKLYITAENEIFTNRGWVPADCINVGDMVYLYYDRKNNSNTVGLHSRDNRWGGDNHDGDKVETPKKNTIPVMAYNLNIQSEPRFNELAGECIRETIYQQNSPNWITENERRVGVSKNRVSDEFQRRGIPGYGITEHHALSDNKERASTVGVGILELPQDSTIQQPLRQSRIRNMSWDSQTEFAIWERVSEIRKSSRQVTKVFDLTTSTSSFFANGILIHNCPVDHEPMPPNVHKVLSTHSGIYKPIAMSRYGEKEMKRLGIDCFYAPHMIDCNTYQPNVELRKAQRESVGWEDKFVIGQVGTNVRERKNWTASFLALQKFRRYHDDVVMYCHTNPGETRGRDLMKLRENLMIKDITFFPSMVNLLLVGIPDIAMNNMYNSLDVYLHPSRGEGFGIPIIEAQACGVPVIVSNNTAQPELCGGGWILKDMRPEFDEQSSWEGGANPDEIVEYLEQAYQEKKSGKLEERKIAAREKALEYDCGAVMENHWKPVLAEIEKAIKLPPAVIRFEHGQRNSDRTKDYRNFFIPQSIGDNAKVLDIGCGVDTPWKSQLQHLGEYTGIDTKASGNNCVLKMDAHALKFPDKSFDFAWCCDVLEHVDNPQRVVNEAKRVAEHGAILFCTPKAPEYGIDPEHKEVGLKHGLTKAGHGVIIF